MTSNGFVIELTLELFAFLYWTITISKTYTHGEKFCACFNNYLGVREVSWLFFDRGSVIWKVV